MSVSLDKGTKSSEQAKNADKRTPKPGPADYGTYSCFPTAGESTISERSHMSSCMPSKFSGASTGRGDKISRDDEKGPGKYNNHDCTIGRKRTGTLGFGQSTATRLLSEPAKKDKTQKTPGPGDGFRCGEFGEESSMHERAPKPKFGSEKRELRMPGVVAWTKDEAKAVEEKTKRKMPGPGDHNPSVTTTSKVLASPKAHFTGKKETHTNTLTQNPGVGMYTLRKEIDTAGVKIGQAARGPLKKEKEKTPGPGAYGDSTTPNPSTTPQWSMPGRAEFGKEWGNFL